MGGWRRVGAAFGVAVFGLGLTACQPGPSPWRAEPLVMNAAGTDTGSGSTWSPSFSADGTKVAFASASGDLLATDPGFGPNVYVRDLTDGSVTLVSADPSGTAGGNGSSGDDVAISPDGTKVAFSSQADNFGPTDTDRSDDRDIYLRDLTTNTTTLVSANAAGTDSANAQSVGVVFSPDGTKLAYESNATNLGPAVTAHRNNIYVHDIVAGTTTLVSRNSAGTDGGNLGTTNPVFSPGGAQLAFVSEATDLVATDNNGARDVFVHDVAGATTSLVSANASGTDSAAGESASPRFNPDGTKVAFHSRAGDFGPVDSPRASPTNDDLDVYVRDLVTATTTLVSVNAAGTDSGNQPSHSPAYSPTGDKVAFTTPASNLWPSDTNQTWDIYLRDLAAGTTSLISANAAGTNGGNQSTGLPADGQAVSFSPDGTEAAFTSGATNLGPAMLDNDPGSVQPNVFVRHLTTGTTSLVSTKFDGTGQANGPEGPNGESDSPAFSPDGRRVVFRTWGTDFGPPDHNDRAELYLALLHEADLGITITADPSPVHGGAELVYRAEVTNGGPDVAPEVVVTVAIPTGTTLTSFSTSHGTCSDPTPAAPDVVTCQLGSLQANESGLVTLQVTVFANEGTALKGAAVASGRIFDAVPGNNVATVSTPVQ